MNLHFPLLMFERVFMTFQNAKYFSYSSLTWESLNFSYSLNFGLYKNWIIVKSRSHWPGRKRFSGHAARVFTILYLYAKLFNMLPAFHFVQCNFNLAEKMATLLCIIYMLQFRRKNVLKLFIHTCRSTNILFFYPIFCFSIF